MIPFNLEEYLKNPAKKVVTRDGRKARVVCTDKKGKYPIVALVENYDGTYEYDFAFTKDGMFYTYTADDKDLFFAPEAPEKHEGWVNIYKNERDHYFGKFIYPKKTDAEAVADSTCIATVKIE